jgi:hypothetical protein
VIDRTYSCTNVAKAGIRELSVSARDGYREAGVWKWLASAGVGNSSIGDFNWGAGVAAGAGAVPEGPQGNNPGVSLRTKLQESACSPSRAPVRLTSRGLSGGAAGFGDEYECVVPARVLVRFRGVFGSAVSLQPEVTREPDTRSQSATGPLRRAFLAVRTPAGKPLVFADVSESGKARLFVSSSCVGT